MPAHSSTSNSSHFKKNTFLWIMAGLFFILVVVAIQKIGDMYHQAADKNIINTYNRLRFEEFYESENIDLVFLGSSHAYCTFDPAIFDEALGTFSYQMGMPLQHPDTSYYTLLEVLNYQHPDIVVLELYWDMMTKDFDVKQADTLFEVLENPELEEQYFKIVYPFNEKIKHFIPTARYSKDYFSYKNKEALAYTEAKWGLVKTIKPTIGTEYYRSQGYVLADYVLDEGEYDQTNQYKHTDGKNIHLSDVQLSYVKKIADLCKEYNMQLFFVTAPVANVSLEWIENYDLIHDQIQALADECDVAYLDFNAINQKESLFANENFRDDAHLNHSGVEIASSYYINYLKQQAKQLP